MNNCLIGNILMVIGAMGLFFAASMEAYCFFKNKRIARQIDVKMRDCKCPNCLEKK